MSMTKVLIVANNINPVDGGIATFIMNEFLFIDKTKVHFDFVIHEPQKEHIIDFIEKSGSEIYQVSPFNPISYRRFWKKFLREHHDYDIIHVHSYDPTILYLGLARKYGITTIVHSHTTKMPKFDLVDRICRLNQFGSRFVADYFLGCSHKAIADRFGKKIEQSSRSKMIPNGIDTEHFRFNLVSRKKIREELGIGGKIVIGHVGRMEYSKNQIFTLQVFSVFSKMNPESILVFIGNGVDEEKIRNEATRLGLDDCVRFAGRRSDVSDCLSAFDIFMFPSVYEGLGIALVEAQCSGLICFASDIIVDEADMGCGLLTRMSLKESPEKWAETIAAAVPCIDTEKRDKYPEMVRNKGFGIQESAKILEDFYVEHSKDNKV